MPELLGLPLDEAPNGLLGVDTISEKGDAEATAYAAFTLYAITADMVRNDLLVEDDLLGAFVTALETKAGDDFDDLPALIAQAETYADNSSAKPLRDTFDLLETAFDENSQKPRATVRG
jgi:hypothetical protein